MTDLVIEYLDSQGKAVGLGSNAVVVVAGAVTVLNDPGFEDVEVAITSLQASPSNSTIPKGASQQFSAVAIFANGEQADLTSSVVWASSTPATATVDSRGLATSVDPGNTTVTATLGNVTGSTVLTVTAARLASLSITPASPSLPLGRALEFTVDGTFTDGTHADLSNAVTWSSASANVATISASGRAEALTVGSSLIGASLNGVSASTTLTTTAALLTAIDISPKAQLLPVGQTLQLVATGTFSDGTSQALSTGLSWSSSVPAVASVDGAGLATGLADGQTLIVATDTVTGVSGEVQVSTFTRVVLSRLEVTPTTSVLVPGRTEALTATATYSNGTSQNVTSAVVWASSDVSVVSVSSSGLITALRSGNARISATLSGLTSSGDVDVVSGTLYIGRGDSNGSVLETPFADNGAVSTKLAVGNVVEPTGLVIDAMGNLFVCDGDSRKIGRVAPDGVYSTFATINANFLGVMVIDEIGNLFVTEQYSELLTKVTPAGIVSKTGVGQNSYLALALGPDKNLYLADFETGDICQVSPQGVVLNATYGTGTGLPFGLVFAPDGRLFVADILTNRLFMIPPGGGAATPFPTTGVPLRFSLSLLVGMAFGSDGSIYVTSTGTSSVVRVTEAGVASNFRTGISEPTSLLLR